MTTEEFRKFNPEFQYRLLVKKEFGTEIPTGVRVSIWMKNTFGAKSDRWLNQPSASIGYIVVWFKTESDLMWAQLRWS